MNRAAIVFDTSPHSSGFSDCQGGRGAVEPLGAVAIVAMLVALACTCVTAAPKGWWDGRWHYRAQVVDTPIGP